MPRAHSLRSEMRRMQAVEVGMLLARAREGAGRSQAEAADRVGLSQSTIAKLEAGARRLGLLEALELAEFYEVSPLAFAPAPDEASAAS